jgi:pantetheine-phosphate adenylyltransferase
MTAVLPGSFDPITLGHVDLVQRAAGLFHEVVVGVLHNPAKAPWFSVDERCALVAGALAGLDNVRVDTFAGLLVHWADALAAPVVVKGLRSGVDFEYEKAMALANRGLAPKIETVFLLTDARYAHLSSSLAREVALLGGPVEGLVPANVVQPLTARAAERKRG